MEIKKKFVINAAFYGIILALVIGLYRYILPLWSPSFWVSWLPSLSRSP